MGVIECQMAVVAVALKDFHDGFLRALKFFDAFDYSHKFSETFLLPLRKAAGYMRGTVFLNGVLFPYPVSVSSADAAVQ